MGTTLAQVLARFGASYLSEHGLSGAQARAWRAIINCRTPTLGGERLGCNGCGARQWRWHSCRNRHCPRCQSRERDAWRRDRLAELLDVPYCHLVFTLPHELNALAAVHPRWVYETLMRSTATTLQAFAANERWLGGTGAFTQVLHTWTQDLRRHLHVHVLMACGALHADGQRWLAPKRSARFLFPVRALSRVFRGKFLHALDEACRSGALDRDPADSRTRQRERRQALLRHDWVVYARTPLAGPAAVLDYLSRYTHRTAVGHERLVGIRGEQVLLRVRAGSDDEAVQESRIVAIDGVRFIARLLQHVLPGGFKRIRHYGLLAAAVKTQRLAAARQALAMPAPNPRARDSVRQFWQRVAGIAIDRCPRCGLGQWRVIEHRAPDRAGFARQGPRACRGPP